MGRPARNPDEKRIICMCESCSKKGRPQQEQYFYSANTEMGKYPICKSCIKDLLADGSKESVLKLLKAMNYPYFDKIWDNAVATSPTNAFGSYIAKISSLQQYKGMGGEDGEKGEKKKEEKPVEKKDIEELEDEEIEDISEEEKKSLIKLFGRGFSLGMLLAMKEKYDELKVGYPDTPLHREALITYVKYKVNEESCIANGDAEGAEMWSKLAQKQADSAKLNPKQLKDQDLSGDLSSIAMLSLMVEENADIIPKYPVYEPGPRDLADFTIYMLTDRVREELGLPPCKYEDIIKWYDDLADKYIIEHPEAKDILMKPEEHVRERAKEFLERCQNV